MKKLLILCLTISCFNTLFAQSIVAPSFNPFQGSASNLIFAGGAINNSYQTASTYISHGNIFLIVPGSCLDITPTLNLKNEFELSVGIQAQSYQWYLNDQAIPDAISPIYFATKSGRYYVSVIVSSQCPKLTSSTIVFNILSNEEERTFKISPNPSVQYLQIEFPIQFDTLASIQISDLLGREIKYQENFSSGQKVDIQHLATGTYLAILKSKNFPNNWHTFKFLKTN